MTIVIIVGILVAVFGFVIIFGAPYVPSHRKYVERLFHHIKIDTNDVVVDVGSGDGVVLRAAARRGARAIGYEIHPLFVLISRLLAVRSGSIEIHLANFWMIQLPAETTVVYIFAVMRDGNRLMRKLQAEATRLGKPLKVVCYGSPFKNVDPIETYDAYYIYQFYPLHSEKAQV